MQHPFRESKIKFVNIQEHCLTVSKTALGIQVMKDRSVSLTAQQRSALILCDGKRSDEEVVRMTAAVGVTLQDVQRLVELGLVAINDVVASPQASPSLSTTPQPLMPVVDESKSGSDVDVDIDFGAALNAAITLCSSLGFKGFGLNMSLTGVDNLEKLQKLAPEIRRAAGDAKYRSLHALVFGKPL